MSAKVVKIMVLVLSLSASLAQAAVLASYSCQTTSGHIAQVPSTFKIQNQDSQVSVSYTSPQNNRVITIVGAREGAEYLPGYNQVAGQEFVTPDMALYDNFTYTDGNAYLETQGDTNEETFFVAADPSVLSGAASGQVKVFYDRGFFDGQSVIADCTLNP